MIYVKEEEEKEEGWKFRVTNHLKEHWGYIPSQAWEHVPHIGPKTYMVLLYDEVDPSVPIAASALYWENTGDLVIFEKKGDEIIP